MRPVALPDVPYGATAIRPDWTDLPTELRTAIEHHLGAPVTTATSATGGFTRTYAGILTTARGQQFVKAAPANAPESSWYAQEHAITAALPPEVRAARPLWALATSEWYAVSLTAINGHVPRLPWSEPELEAALTTWSTAAAALSTPPEALRGLPGLPSLIRDHLSWWTPIAAGHVPMPEFAPTWAHRHLNDLVALEQALPALTKGAGVTHGDLRVDNILIDSAGEAWLCDWTWPCLGAPWFDTVTLLVSAYASGLDADAALSRWATAASQPSSAEGTATDLAGPALVPALGVDGVLAAMGGYWLVHASAPPTSASPHSGQHHRFSGTQALAWLAERRGWS